jgi:hypothetical protein
MVIILAIMAGSIFLLYSFYFFRIIKGDPEKLEIEMLKSLADWIIRKKASSKPWIWSVLALSVLAEIIYFYLALVLIANPVMRIFTGLLILYEINHLISLFVNLRRFFSGQNLLSQIFRWGQERIAALLFFTHTFLVLAILAAFS